MKRYTLKPETRAAMKAQHRLAQAFIAVTANAKFDILENARGISKYEGGVVVNNCEIAIFKDRVRDDWKRPEPDHETPEEIATVEAIQILAEYIENGAGIPEYSTDAMSFSDPLRAMFEV